MSKGKSQDIWNSPTLRIIMQMRKIADRHGLKKSGYQSIWEFLSAEGRTLDESEKEHYRALIRRLDEEKWFAGLADKQQGLVRRWIRQACAVLKMPLPRSFYCSNQQVGV